MSVSPNQQLDSIVSFRNSQGEKASGTLRGVSRQAVSLEVYNPYSVAQMSEMLKAFTIRRQGRVVYEGSAVVTSLINTGTYLALSVTLTDAWVDLSQISNEPQQITQEVNRFLADVSVYDEIEPSFQLAVTRIRTLLSELTRWLEQVDVMMASSLSSSPGEQKEELIETLATPLIPRLQMHLEEFEEVALKIEKPRQDVHRAFIQRDLHPLVMRSPFMHRVYTKPLGYAGDYEMVNMMLRSPNEGPTTYYKIINNLFLLEGPAVAHRNRITILEEILQKHTDDAARENRKIRILNLGCGPAVEIQRLLRSRKLDDRVDITLMDFSIPTLEYTESMLTKISNETGSHPTIHYVHKSVDQILRQSAKKIDEESNTYDFIYCAGLFDYFSDKACSRVLKLFGKLVKPGGLVLSTNVHEDNPAISAMEYLVEWYLIYRNEASMKALTPPGMDAKVYCDETGLNIFLEFWKPLSND